ncbi:hypothetical protein MNO14_08620 [Luteimonas sp. S4-F44]|uniref:hypothetical protein n=1 Tax=Luteimonas sp. S4-F44 TaxID=2925842 RepID=UPI001F533C42|nr:hypothetical protein [Luteimonas sp. S4-F44]UNK41055.1 hypothetical protein MNO14_08620 [Luteimonas sp. S4-F44]
MEQMMELGTPAVLTPGQAVAAAVILEARVVMPIHYGIRGAENYAEAERSLELLCEAAARRMIAVDVLEPGS